MSETEDIRSFTVSFFNNLKSNLFWDNGGKKLTITTVPEDFEKFYGKKAPYELVFSQADAFNNEEVMIKGSFLLNCMKEFLQDKGQTTLVKLNFDFDPAEELQNYLKLRNCKITHVTKKQSYDWLVRFTFLTTLQYLNEKEQIMNPIYVKGNEVIKFDLEKYKLVEGKKEEIQVNDIKNQYNFAKEYLKTTIKPKIEKLSETLNIKLDKEIQRVKQHYVNQIEEDKQNLLKSEKQLKDLENQIKDSNNKNLDKDFIQLRIKKLKETIASLNSEKHKEELKKEENFLINDENHRHGLSVDNRIMNTTIAYFPIFTYSAFLKSQSGTRAFNITFNPITKELSKLNCECCGEEIKEISLCSNGHLSCRTCLRGCSECGEDYCKKCLQNSCFSCSKQICKKCSKHCVSCGKTKCLSHMATSSKCITCVDKTPVRKIPSFGFR